MTQVNIGAGTCLHPDPLYQLLASREGQGRVLLIRDSMTEVEHDRSRKDVQRQIGILRLYLLLLITCYI